MNLTSNVAIGAGGGTTGTFTNGVLNNHAITLNGANNGAATLTATDTPAAGLGNGTQTGTSAVFTVQPAALANFLVEKQGGGAIGTQTAGVAVTIQVTARDTFKNPLSFGANNFTGAGNTVDLTSNVAIGAGGGTTGTFTNGVLNNHAITLNGANNGTATITATDTPAAGLGNGTQTGTSAVFTVQPAALNNLLIPTIGPQTSWVPFSVTLTARDAFNNTNAFGANAFTGTVTVTTSGLLAAGSGVSANFVAGVLTRTLTMASLGTQTITVTQTGGAVAATSNAFAMSLMAQPPVVQPPAPEPVLPESDLPADVSLAPAVLQVRLTPGPNTSFDAQGRPVMAAASPDGSVRITIPVAALPEGVRSVNVTVAPITDTAALVESAAPPVGAVIVAGQAFDIDILNQFGDPLSQFEAPLTLSFQVDPATLDLSTIAVFFYDSAAGAWVQVDPANVSVTADGTVSFAVDHLTLFALFTLPPTEVEELPPAVVAVPEPELAARTIPAAFADLRPGRNLRRWAGESIRVAEALTGFERSVIIVWLWHPYSLTWSSYAPEIPARAQTNFLLTPGGDLWVVGRF